MALLPYNICKWLGKFSPKKHKVYENTQQIFNIHEINLIIILVLASDTQDITNITRLTYYFKYTSIKKHILLLP